MTRLRSPSRIESESHLEEVLAQPYDETVELMRRLTGDIVILGVAVWLKAHA